MVLTNSTMMALGTPAPEFSLPDTNGDEVSLGDFADRDALLVMFICNHCPYVIHVAPQLVELADDYASKGLAVVAISSNDVGAYPDDSPAKMAEEVARRGYPFPYLYDESQAVAKAYTAACTPDFFLFDRGRKLFYRGQLDDSRPKRIRSGVYDSAENPPTGKDLRAAIDALLAGNEPPAEQIPSAGCNIKWKPGGEPDYFG